MSSTLAQHALARALDERRIWREMLCAALDNAADAHREIERLHRQVSEFRAELKRYTAEAVSG